MALNTFMPAEIAVNQCHFFLRGNDRIHNKPFEKLSYKK